MREVVILCLFFLSAAAQAYEIEGYSFVQCKTKFCIKVESARATGSKDMQLTALLATKLTVHNRETGIEKKYESKDSYMNHKLNILVMSDGRTLDINTGELIVL